MTEQSGWQLNGTQPEAYERYIIPAWMGEWAQVLVETGEVGLGKHVLDVACGTGIVARKASPLIGPGGRVVGLDVNEGMIRAADHFAALEGIGNIEWQIGDAACMPFDNAEFDVILCQQGLQFFPDPLASLREMARVMAPHGTLAATVWRSLDRYPYFSTLAAIIEAYLGKEATYSFHASCSLPERQQVRNLIRKAGFSNIVIRLEVRMDRYPSLEEFLPGYLSATPISDQVAVLANNDRTRMFRDIIESLQAFTDDHGLAAPMECHVITAEKWQEGS